MSIGIWQVILILAIVLILFGAGKLPNVMGDIAKGVKSFKAGLKDDADAPAETPPKTLTAEPTPAGVGGAQAGGAQAGADAAGHKDGTAKG
ncbi:MAG: twin-arginine translocase TatA/TatE family subunit [Azospirillum sp.]|nr:twin-arginine translocase TatA/TatE family subunit [Azospirillum sp.]